MASGPPIEVERFHERIERTADAAEEDNQAREPAHTRARWRDGEVTSCLFPVRMIPRPHAGGCCQFWLVLTHEHSLAHSVYSLKTHPV